MPMGIGPGLSVTRGGSVTGIGALGADLALWFDENQAYKSSGGGIVTPDSILTYTAPSPKLVYGSDGVLRYALGDELVSNGDFSGGTTGWTASGATQSVTGGVIRITNDAAAAGYTSQSFTTVVGKVYVISANALGGTSSSSLRVGTSPNSIANLNVAPVGLNSYSFAATATTTHVTLRNGSATAGQYTEWDDVSVKPVALPRDHNPTTGAALGVLVEEARTNLCLYSDDFTNAAWVKSNLTTAKTATGPDGVTNSASTLTATAANATARQDITSASAARITSMFVKRRTGTGAVYLSQGATTGSELVVNGTFTTDTTGWTATAATLAVVSGELEVTNTGASAGFADSDAFATVVGTAYIIGYTARRGTSSSAGIEVRKTAGGAETFVTLTSASNVDGFLYFVASSTSTFIRVSSNQAVLGRTGYFDNISCKVASETTVTVTSDWTRVATASATVTNPPLIIRMATSGDAIDVALFQIENGGFITSPIPTQASQVTRAADNISILTSAFPYSATAGTVFVDGSINGNGTGNTGWWALDAGGTQNGHALRVAVGGNIVAISRGITTNQTVVGLASAVAGTFYGTAFAYSNENDRAISTEGAAAVAGSTAVGTINSATTLRFGFQQVTTTGGYLNGHIKRLAYYASRKTDAELQVLST